MAVLGCIADDFTGAGDAASFLVRGGLNVVLCNGVPENRHFLDENPAEAIVIALKSRSVSAEIAVRESLRAADYLLAQGAMQIYFKYCSTFDSTPEGNIGPVADALMQKLNAPYTILCPALPVNGRTVKGGRLYVYGTPLDASPMRNHPITPMWDSRIRVLMEAQSIYPCRDAAAGGVDYVPDFPQDSEPFYLIPDYERDADGMRIAETFGSLPLLTGSSGLLEWLARRWSSQLNSAGIIPPSGTRGPCLLLAGSCSRATLAQIDSYLSSGGAAMKMEPLKLLDGSQTIDELLKFVLLHGANSGHVLLYSSEEPEKVRKNQLYGKEKMSEALEQAAADLAVRAVHEGFTRIVTAGGETSGAVAKALGFQMYSISGSVAPGVPVMVPIERPELRLVLKSGNFGQSDFFERAIALTEDNKEIR